MIFSIRIQLLQKIRINFEAILKSNFVLLRISMRHLDKGM